MFGSRKHPYMHPATCKVFEVSYGVRVGGGGGGEGVKDFKRTYEAIKFKICRRVGKD